jgi:nucleotide-binding universal stress UspA family protein
MISTMAGVAEEFGVQLALRLRARLLGISVIEERFAQGLHEDGLGVAPPSLEALGSYLKARADAACRRLAERARAAGIECAAETAQGIADDRIVERGQQVDLIVLGRDGQHAAFHTGRIGSTADGVIRKTSKASLVVPEGATLSGPIPSPSTARRARASARSSPSGWRRAWASRSTSSSTRRTRVARRPASTRCAAWWARCRCRCARSPPRSGGPT